MLFWRNNDVIASHVCWHDDVIKWKHFPRYWPFVRGIHRSPVNSPHKGQWRGALMFSLISTRLNGWVNNDEAGDLRWYRAHYDVTVMGNSLMKMDNMNQTLNSPVTSECPSLRPVTRIFSLSCTWINSWAIHRGAGDLRCHHAHYDVTVMNWKDTPYLALTGELWTFYCTCFFRTLTVL